MVPPGLGAIRPMVARAPPAGRGPRAASTAARRAASGRAGRPVGWCPAWLPSPVTVIRQRPWARIDDATPTGAPGAASSGPVRRAVRRNTPMRPSASSGPMPAGSTPAARSASANETPSGSCRRRAASGSIGAGHQPGAQARHAEPAALLLGEHHDRHGLRGVEARGPQLVDRHQRRRPTPSGPSNAPPPGTESRWQPVTTASGPGVPHQAQRLPLRSVSHVQAPRRGLRRRTTRAARSRRRRTPCRE